MLVYYRKKVEMYKNVLFFTFFVIVYCQREFYTKTLDTILILWYNITKNNDDEGR